MRSPLVRTHCHYGTGSVTACHARITGGRSHQGGKRLAVLRFSDDWAAVTCGACLRVKAVWDRAERTGMADLRPLRTGSLRDLFASR